MWKLLPFQQRFLRKALAPEVTTSIFSLPRGNGKSAMLSRIARWTLTPGHELFRPAGETLLISQGVSVASRTVVRLLLDELDQLGVLADYRIQDNSQGVRIVHKKTRTRLSVIPCTSKGATGIVGSDFCLCDEPGSWPKNDGEILYSTLQSSLGKPGSQLRIIYAGTVAPSEHGWWPDLVASTGDPSTFIDRRQADPKKWHLASEIKRLNPLMWRFESSRKLLLRERDAARRDDRKKAAFLSFRMNRPSRDSNDVLLTVTEWASVLSRCVPERQGRPFCGLDLGQHRSWSAVTFLWHNGRVEAHAFCAGIPPLGGQEERDSVPPGHLGP